MEGEERMWGVRNGQSWKVRGGCGGEEWAVVEGEGRMRNGQLWKVREDEGDEEWAVVEGEGGMRNGQLWKVRGGCGG